MFRPFFRRRRRFLLRLSAVALLLGAIIVPLMRSHTAHTVVRLFKYRMNGLDNGIDIPLWQPPGNAVALEDFPDYGPFDVDGIPLRDFGRPKGVVYHPLVIAEYGCAYAQLYALRREDRYATGLRNMADWLAKHQQPDGSWIYDWEYRYGSVVLKPPWKSAVTQSQGAQVLLQTAALLDRPELLPTARRAILVCKLPLQEGGLRLDVGDGWFYEEYPSDPPTHVLNAHLRVLVTCAEFLEQQEDTEIREVLTRGLTAFRQVLPKYDTGLWTRYDLLPSHRGQHVIVGMKNKQVPKARWTSSETAKVVSISTPAGVKHTDLHYFRIAVPVSAADQELIGPPNVTLEFETSAPCIAYLSWREDVHQLI